MIADWVTVSATGSALLLVVFLVWTSWDGRPGPDPRRRGR